MPPFVASRRPRRTASSNSPSAAPNTSPGASGGDALRGARALAAYAQVVVERSPVLIALHTDHSPPARLSDFLDPLISLSEHRGAPLFQSHMFDGSTLPLAENLRISRRLLGRCAGAGIVLEIE